MATAHTPITPTANYNGPVSLSYKVSDGTTTTNASLGFSLAAVNDAPVVSFGGDFAVDERRLVMVTLTRTGDLSQLSTVNWFYSGGTANFSGNQSGLPADYAHVAGFSSQITFVVKLRTIPIDILNDSIEEDAETIQLSLLNSVRILL